jgi:hypothetical protein
MPPFAGCCVRAQELPGNKHDTVEAIVRGDPKREMRLRSALRRHGGRLIV